MSNRMTRGSVVAIVAVCLFFTVRALSAKEHEKPADAVVLFDGKDLSRWMHKDGSAPKWKIVDGAIEVGPGDLTSREAFQGDFILHVEFMPNDVGPGPTGQARGNSGVYIQDNYEIQVLDSYGIKDMTPGDCAGIYSKKPADKNMSKKPGEWQTYHIEYRSPKFDAKGKKIKNARITLEWNGEVVHKDFEIDGICPGGSGERLGAGPISLQDHGNPVRFRNIWVAPMKSE
jgi:hypothetical protein